jgi:hypothetical protein
MTGIGGSASIDGWLRICITLDNGMMVDVVVATTDGIKFMILGMPFMRLVAGRVDFALDCFEVPRQGFLDLVTKTADTFSISIIAGSVELLKEELRKVAKFGGPISVQTKLRDLLLEFSDLWQNERRGCTSLVEHKIRVTTPYAISTPPRRMALEQQQVADAELEKMLIAGVIEPSTSPYVSEPVIIRKKTGDWRYCIDFRKLNEYTIPDPYPMRRIDDLLASIRSSIYFIAIDLRSGYWQIPLETESRKFTAFRTSRGLYQFTVMPFGLSNAPATFQRCMEEILGDLHWQGVLVYLDDILIHADQVESCLELVKEVFRRLRQANLTINLKKCQFLPESMKYLGHIIGGGTIRPDLTRVSCLQHIKTPTTVKELRSIFGLLSYYRQYIPSFADKAIFLTSKLKKNASLIWTEGDSALIQTLIAELQQAVLTVPLKEDQFVVETDASDVALGAILSVTHDGKRMPVEFASKLLSPAQRNWPAREREAFAIVWAVYRFDGFLRGRQFDVFTDHESLKFLFRATEGKLARWAARLAEYDIMIHYQKGKDHHHVDMLSRYIEPVEAEFPDRAFCFTANAALPTIGEVLSKQRTRLPPLGRGYIYREGITYYRNGIWVPEGLRGRILDGCHVCFPDWHCGARKTKTRILKVWNCPTFTRTLQGI